MSLARKVLKAAALPLGLAGYRRSGDLAILLYHRVGTGEREVDLPVETFERQMAHLAKSGLARSLDGALRGREAGKDRGGVVVSFDDGYLDFHEQALPILARYSIPAVLYLATGLVRGERSSRSEREHLSWSHLHEATATGLITVGAHTHTHPDLSRASPAMAEQEMRRSKELIEDHLGVPCRHFAYPFAMTSPAAEDIARRLFQTAALGAWRVNRRGKINPYRLDRIPVLRSDGHAFFRGKIAGLLYGEALAYRLLGRGPWRRG